MTENKYTKEQINLINSIVLKKVKQVPKEIDDKYSKYFDRESSLYSLKNLGMVYNEIGKELYDLLADKYGALRSM
jgi:hypothetical protein